MAQKQNLEEVDDLGELVGSLPVPEQHRQAVDVTRLFPKKAEAGKKVTFVYRDLNTPELFSIPSLMRDIQFQHEDWKDELTGVIAILVSCHVSPVGKGEGLQNQTYVLYCELARRLPKEDWLWFVDQFFSRFPHLDDFLQSVAERKKK